MQKRLTRKLDLELFLSKIEPHPSPKVNLEQYTIPVDAAATMLHIAAYTYDDIVDKTVLDLGCGTGRLALGAVFLGAREAIGVDIDKAAIEVASRNATKLGLEDKLQWIISDVGSVCGEFDTVVQNPPFGVQNRHADRKFLEKALEMSMVVYSLHKHPKRDRVSLNLLKADGMKIIQTSPSPFMKSFTKKLGGFITAVYSIPMTIPHTFDFHTKRKHKFVADLYVLKRM